MENAGLSSAIAKIPAGCCGKRIDMRAGCKNVGAKKPVSHFLAIQEAMGHKDCRSTLVYITMTVADIEEARRRMKY